MVLRRETNAERVRRLTEVGVAAQKKGENAQAAIRETVQKEEAEIKKGKSVRVEEETGITYLVEQKPADKPYLPDKTTSFKTIRKTPEQEAKAQQLRDAQAKLARGEQLTPRDVIAPGGQNLRVTDVQNIQDLGQASEENRYKKEVAAMLEARQERRDAKAQEAKQEFRDTVAANEQYASYEKKTLFTAEKAEVLAQRKRLPEGFAERTKNVRKLGDTIESVRQSEEDILRKIPLLGGDNIVQTNIRAVLEWPVTIPGSVILIGASATNIAEGLIRPDTRPLVTNTLGASVVPATSTLFSSLKPTSPTGVANTLLLFAPAAIKGAKFAKDTVIKTTKPRIPPEAVIDAEVLAGTEKFPVRKAGETDVQVLNRFESGRTPTGEVEVVSAGPAKYPGQTVLAGERAQKGLEDPGLFVAPRGQASANFLRISEQTSPKISINPFAGASEIVNTPSITYLTAKNVRLFPTQILRTQGFEQSAKYASAPENTGTIFITKRSTTGITGRASNTAEIEGTSVAGTKFTYTDPFAAYTEYKGKVVAIRKATLLTSKDATNVKSVSTSGRLFTSYEEYNSYYSKTGNKQGLPYSVSSAKTSKSLSEPYSLKVYPVTIKSSTYLGSSKPKASAISSQKSVLKPVSSQTEFSVKEIRQQSTFTKNAKDSPTVPSYNEVSAPGKSLTIIPTKAIDSNYKYGSSKVSVLSVNQRSEKFSKYKFDDTKRDRPKQQGFNVFVRRQGKFQQVNVGSLSYTEAKAFGANVVQNTAAATFKVTPGGAVSGSYSGFGSFADFYKKGEQFIQKRSKRIGTVGEKREITYKGIAARRGSKFGTVFK